MGSSTPSLFPMLRLWAIILFCLLTYVHATATLSKEIAAKTVRSLSLVDHHGLLTLVATSEGVPTSGPFGDETDADKAADQAQVQQAAC